MAEFISRVRDTMKKPPMLLESAGVLRRAGLIRPGRPDEALRNLLTVRQLGPFAGAVRIAARRDPAEIGLVDELGALTFGQLDHRSNALARAWRTHGIVPRDVVGLLCRNHRGFLDTMFACAKLGVQVVLLNTGFAGRQLAEVAEREGITVLVYDQEFAPIIAPAPPSVRRYLAWVDVPRAVDVPTLDELIAGTDQSDVPAPRAFGGMVLLTSGTTGTPKGATRQVRSPLVAAEFLDRIPYRRGAATLIAAPLFHATGVSQMAMTLVLGSTLVVARRFDPASTLSRVHHYRCSAVVLIPTMLQRILDLGDNVISKYDTSSLRIVLCAGSALSPDLGNRATRAFGHVIYNLYGSTEVAVATIATPRDWHRAPGTVGRPPVGCRVHLYDAHGKPVTQPYQQGRIFVGSGLKFGGYTGGGGKEEIDGLLASGDVGHFDRQGLLFVDGRADDMIISGGENVYPGEVENLLVEHPAIYDAAVVGVPDHDFGQRLKAYVVLRQGAWVTPGEIQAYVKGHLARFKVPREVAYVHELPRNPTGKLLRHLLR